MGVFVPIFSDCKNNPMGFQFGINSPATCFPRKFRWMFGLDDISPHLRDGSVNVLPPKKAARPQITFKDMEAQHLSETVFFPGKAEWKPINITLYDLPKDIGHPVFEWVRRIYRPEPQHDGDASVWTPSVECDCAPRRDLLPKKGCAIRAAFFYSILSDVRRMFDGTRLYLRMSNIHLLFRGPATSSVYLKLLGLSCKVLLVTIPVLGGLSWNPSRLIPPYSLSRARQPSLSARHLPPSLTSWARSRSASRTTRTKCIAKKASGRASLLLRGSLAC